MPLGAFLGQMSKLPAIQVWCNEGQDHLDNMGDQQGRSTTLTCFGNYEMIATFRQKLSKHKNRQKNALEQWRKKISKTVSRY